jgi:adenosylcobyric acid synthase
LREVGSLIDLAQHRRTTIVGVCGGYQMLGRSIRSAGVESQAGWAAGLNPFPAQTTLMPTSRLGGVGDDSAGRLLAATRFMPASRRSMRRTTPFATLEDGTADGARANRVLGTIRTAPSSIRWCVPKFGTRRLRRIEGR